MNKNVHDHKMQIEKMKKTKSERILKFVQVCTPSKMYREEDGAETESTANQ